MRLNQGSIGTVAVSTITDSITRLLGVTREFVENEARNARAWTSWVNQAAVAAQYSHVQILNPVGSGKLVIVRSLQALVDAGPANCVLTDYATALTTAVTPTNKYLGGAAILTRVRQATNAAQLGNVINTWRGETETLVELVKGEPFVLAAGTAITVVHGVVNKQLIVYAEGTEE